MPPCSFVSIAGQSGWYDASNVSSARASSDPLGPDPSLLALQITFDTSPPEELIYELPLAFNPDPAPEGTIDTTAPRFGTGCLRGQHDIALNSTLMVDDSSGDILTFERMFTIQNALRW